MGKASKTNIWLEKLPLWRVIEAEAVSNSLVAEPIAVCAACLGKRSWRRAGAWGAGQELRSEVLAPLEQPTALPQQHSTDCAIVSSLNVSLELIHL